MSAAQRLLIAKRKALKSRQKKTSYPKWEMETFLFKEQLAFVRDPARYALACCSVRSGKTTACAADLIDTALRMPGTTSLYITLARSSGERIVWPELLKINREFGLQAEINIAKLSLKFPNGSIIYLFGANDDAQVEMIRGLSNVALVYLDESQAFRELIRGLVDDIVSKRLYDTGGRCRMIGTPGPLLSGYFYESCEGQLKDGWSRHHWTMFQNPWLHKKSGKTPQELTDEDCARRGVALSHPSIQRENYGRWVFDPKALLLSYDKTINDFDQLPKGHYTYIMGIDLGQRDYNFISVLAFSDTSPVTWLVEEKYAANQRTDDLASDIKGLLKKYDTARLIVDAGGLGLTIVEDMKARHGLPLQAADKKDKMANYALLNNALRTGNFRAKYGTKFQEDCNLLQRDDDKSTPDRMVIKGHSDAIDAALYAFKLSPAFTYSAPPPSLKPGTPEYDNKISTDLMDHNLLRIEQARQLKDGQARSWISDDQGIAPWNKWGE